MPVHVVETLNRVTAVRKRLESRSGVEPTPEEIADQARVPVATVKLLLETSRPPASLDAPIGDETTLGDVLEDRAAVVATDPLLADDLTRQIEHALAGLAARERDIIRLRFGLGGGEPLTLEAIGRSVGLTRERIRQIEVRALRKLHPQLRSFTEN
jgi:RNA polymerase primary sigma factor